MSKPPSCAERRYSLGDIAGTMNLARAFEGMPEVSGAITKSFEFKLRVVFPWDRYTQSLLAARTGPIEQLELLRSLQRTLQLTVKDTPLTAVHLAVSERASRLFKTPGDEPGMTVLLSLTLSYSAHRTYRGEELRQSLGITVNHDRYAQDALRVTLLPNH